MHRYAVFSSNCYSRRSKSSLSHTVVSFCPADLTDGLPFIDLHMTEAKEFAIMLEQLYASDRDAIPKGVVEVIL